MTPLQGTILLDGWDKVLDGRMVILGVLPIPEATVLSSADFVVLYRELSLMRRDAVDKDLGRKR